MNWRSIYLLSIPFRIWLVFELSYIHPDEHFQSLEVLCNYILGYSTNLPWEFTPETPSRSFGPLLLVYGPSIIAGKWLSLPPLSIYFICKLKLCLLTELVTHWCLYKLMPTKKEKIKAVYLNSLSYITLVYQSHTFSNSVETLVVLLCLVIINELKIGNHKSSTIIIWLAFLITFGVFNRITFLAWVLIPSWYLLQYFASNFKALILFILFGLLFSSGFIATDTLVFNSSEWLLTPINNLLYNLNYDNLAVHGLDSRFKHIFVNIPTMLGPGLLLFSRKHLNSLPFFSLVSGVCFLSVFPHQELRFLMPAIPLLSCCFNIQPRFSKYLLKAFIAFNIIMSILMGVFHQGGVVPALNELHNMEYCPSTTVQVWWRTYKPPSYFLELSDQTVKFTNKDQDSKDELLKGDIIDAMGMPLEDLSDLLSKIDRPIKLITPVGSSLLLEGRLNETWTYLYHIDLDHLENFAFGIGIYDVIN
ncbi:BA75_03628T0 [Komagataella pastoris]|uniref:Mannosyltransferase n=1 Tax=Komagataella pastoris TaxID=4922 RepID=A0A1B2JF62_PICPA|nr:BA75_03628T0 [Komagataella pastoris]